MQHLLPFMPVCIVSLVCTVVLERAVTWTLWSACLMNSGALCFDLWAVAWAGGPLWCSHEYSHQLALV
jgi:hypothetical protein